MNKENRINYNLKHYKHHESVIVKSANNAIDHTSTRWFFEKVVNWILRPIATYNRSVYLAYDVTFTGKTRQHAQTEAGLWWIILIVCVHKQMYSREKT